MSSERLEESYEPVLRLDYDIKAPGFFSYVRWAVRGKAANFETLVASKVSDVSSRNAFVTEIRTATEAFEKTVSSAEGLADRKRQSDMLNSAVTEFNKSMKGLEIRIQKEIKSQSSGGHIPRQGISIDDFSLRSADASRFLEENGM